MRTIIILLLLASPSFAQCYADLDLMGANVRALNAQSDYDFSPRITLGYQHDDVGARVRYWHLDSVLLEENTPHIDFDVLDLEAYKQWDGIRAFGGLRVAHLQDYIPNSEFLFDGAVRSFTFGDTAFGPTAGVEGNTSVYGNVSANYGIRASVLLATWYDGLGDPLLGPRAMHIQDTQFVPEIYAGLTYHWEAVGLGTRFEIQHWSTDLTSNLIPPITVVGIGGTASVSW